MTPCQTLQTKPVLKMSVSNFGVFSFDFLFVDIIWFQNDFEASVSNSAQFVQTCWNWDINITSLHCIAYIYHNLRAENLVFDQTIFSHYLSSRQYIDIVRRNYTLVMVVKGLKEVQCSFYILKIAASFFNFVMRNFSKCSIVSTSLVFLCFFPSNGVAFSSESFISDLGNNFKDFFLFFDSSKYVFCGSGTGVPFPTWAGGNCQSATSCTNQW